MEIKCENLDRIRKQLEEIGVIQINKNNSLTEAKLAIVQSLGRVEFVDGDETKTWLDIQETSDPKHQKFIREAREEANKSICWVTKVGCVVVNKDDQIITRDYNKPVLPGKHCDGLDINIDQIMSFLKPGERLDFCQTRHDVESAITQAAYDGFPLGHQRWYLSLEPCDRCANDLVGVKPEGVYFTAGVGRKKYYNSVGLERLLAAEVPVFFVRMPDDEKEN